MSAASETWVVVDSEGKRVSSISCFTETQALIYIDQWLRRNERGGRPDLSREWLLGLKAKRIR